jgi:hypothetical protein
VELIQIQLRIPYLSINLEKIVYVIYVVGTWNQSLAFPLYFGLIVLVNFHDNFKAIFFSAIKKAGSGSVTHRIHICPLSLTVPGRDPPDPDNDKTYFCCF